MAKSRRLHPQFFHTLVPGFHTHLMIPVDFFSKYIEGRSVENTAELKSDASDVTWRVKMTGRRLSDGWEEFAVAHHLQIGDVVLVRYKGDMVFHVSDLGPDDCCEIPDIHKKEADLPSFNSGKILLKKHPRTDVGDDTDLPKKKKVKTNSYETESDSSEASNEEAAFSLCYPESNSDREQEEYSKAIKKQSLFIDPSNRFKISKYENSKEESRQRDSSSPSQNRFVTITIRPDTLRYNRMRLPKHFVKENSMNKPGVIYLLGKDDTKWMAKLVEERDGRMKLGNGWTVFAEANDFKPGESVTLESIWEDETPMLRFLRRESKSSKANKKESISTEDTEPRTRDSSSTIQDGRFVTLTLTPEDVRARMLILPSQFLKANGINKLGKITILGENKMETSAYILSRNGIVALENGWDEFCQANGVKLGESFTLEFINEPDKTTVLKFCSQ